jgi:hypothetical protein
MELSLEAEVGVAVVEAEEDLVRDLLILLNVVMVKITIMMDA